MLHKRRFELVLKAAQVGAAVRRAPRGQCCVRRIPCRLGCAAAKAPCTATTSEPEKPEELIRANYTLLFHVYKTLFY